MQDRAVRSAAMTASFDLHQRRYLLGSNEIANNAKMPASHKAGAVEKIELKSAA
jgi:hypothetical protein